MERFKVLFDQFMCHLLWLCCFLFVYFYNGFILNLFNIPTIHTVTYKYKTYVWQKLNIFYNIYPFKIFHGNDKGEINIRWDAEYFTSFVTVCLLCLNAQPRSLFELPLVQIVLEGKKVTICHETFLDISRLLIGV